MVFIDVNLGKDKGKQKLVVYDQDSPSVVSRKFGLLHDLKPEKVSLLEKLLRSKI